MEGKWPGCERVTCAGGVSSCKHYLPFGITVYAINLAGGANVLHLGAESCAECGCKGVGSGGVVHIDIIRLIIAR
jgi:hypothetical protein